MFYAVEGSNIIKLQLKSAVSSIKDEICEDLFGVKLLLTLPEFEKELKVIQGNSLLRKVRIYLRYRYGCKYAKL